MFSREGQKKEPIETPLKIVLYGLHVDFIFLTSLILNKVLKKYNLILYGVFQ